MDFICDNLNVNENGVLTFNGYSAEDLIKEYGSPLYVFDENKIRENARIYVNAMKKYFTSDSYPLFASKAASFKQIYRIVNEEGMGSDVVSCGEIYVAKMAGFPLENTYFHSNNKTDADIEFAMDNNVGYIVVDNKEELDAVSLYASKRNMTQKILIRLTPGIDPHTYEAVATGKVDSKFGSAIATGAAETIFAYALTKSNIDIVGFHCHVGSQLFDSSVYEASSKIMLGFIALCKNKYNFITRILNIGGGYGVRYVKEDPIIDIEENIKNLSIYLKNECKELGISLPSIRMEPGRSIVANAGITLYTAGSKKIIEGYKAYVSIDGGMTDNPRYALYKSKYTVLNASRMNEACDFVCSVVGRCCESGDIIQENVSLPSATQKGDIIAVLTTGAYNYSMASNYNKIPRLPIIMVNKEKSYIAVKRESFEDLVRNDI